MKRIFAAVMLVATLAPTAQAQSLHSSRFTHEKTGYVVTVRHIGSRMLLTGKHPTTGERFELVSQRSGRVTGTFNGQLVNFVVGARASEASAAASHAMVAGAQ